MATTFRLHLTIIELAQYTAELFRQGIQYTVTRCDFDGSIGEYSFTLTGY